MKQLTEYLSYTQENEESINESSELASVLAILCSCIAFSMQIWTITDIVKDENPLQYFKSEIKNWWYDKKAKKIIKKLLDDDDIKDFFNQPQYKQKTGWRKLLTSKLSDDELKYLTHITKRDVLSQLNKN